MRKGDHVWHEEFGPGIVETLVPGGRVQVQFENTPSILRLVARADLLPADAAAELGRVGATIPGAARGKKRQSTVRSAAVVAEPTPPSPACTLDPHDAWQVLEALRLGVVPLRGVRDYTVARTHELDLLQQLLAAGRGCRVIWGDYGTGKTHLLDTAEQLALELGFVTARVTLDPSRNSLHQPMHVYRAIMDQVRLPTGSGLGFEPVLDRLMESSAHFHPRGDRASRFFSPYLHALRSGDAETTDVLRDYVGGYPMDPVLVNRHLRRVRWPGSHALALSEFRTYGRMYIHLVGTLASWCADAGFEGLTLLFDEVERVDALGREDQHYAFEVLRHYAAVTMDPLDLDFDPESLYKGGQEIHRQIPLRFRDDQPLAAVFALTPLEEIVNEFREITSSTRHDVRLGPLGHRDLPELVRRIAMVYTRAFPSFLPSAETLHSIAARLDATLDSGHDSFRSGVRASVFLLDEVRLDGRYA